MDYATSRDVHRCLHQAFGPLFRGNRFQRFGPGICSYVKKLDENVTFAFEVQCNSFGSSEGGNLFCINAGAGSFLKRSDTSGYLYRILPYVDAATAEQATQLLHQINVSSPTRPRHDRDWRPGRDNWCQYYSVTEVAQWGEFLRPHLPELVHQLVVAKQEQYASFIPILVGPAA